MLKGIFGILIGLLLVLSVMFGKLVVGSELKAEQNISIEEPKHHLQLIVQNTDEYFWTFFQQGVKAAEAETGVYVEFVKVQRNIDNLRETVEMAVNAGVDGIALQAADSEQTQLIVEEAKNEGIAVITYENDNFNIPNTPVVGTNSYNLGCIAGDLAVEASGGTANVAVIINNAGNLKDVQYKNGIVLGIKNSFGIYSTININDNNIYTVNADLFEVERLATSIIEKSNVNLIICIDEGSTPGIAQVLVDNNKVGDIKLIGYGVTPKTLNYIERGVIYGSVCPDAYEIGYYTVKQLAQSLNGEQISDYISTKLFTIDYDNVKDYIRDEEED